MNPNQCRVVLRPRSPFEVFDLVLRFVRLHWRLFFKLGALVVLPVWLVVSVIAYFADAAWPLAIALVASPFIQLPFTVAGGRLLFVDRVTVRESLSGAFGLLGALFGTLPVGFVVVLVSAVFCSAPYVLIGAATAFLPETAFLERGGVQKGLQRSFRLAGANLLSALAVTASRVFLTLWMGVVFEGTGQLIVDSTFQLGTPLGTLWAGDVTPFFVLGVLAAQPLHALYRLFLYVDVRTRAEGWDLQVGFRAARLGRLA